MMMDHRRVTRPLNKVNVAPVVADHYRTLTDHKEAKGVSWGDVLLMVGGPLLVGAVLAIAGFRAYGVAVVASAVSIFAVLMFSLLVVALNMMLDASSTAREQGPSSATRRRAWVAGEFGANVAYAVLVAVITAAVVVAFAMSIEPDDSGVQVLSPVPTGVVTALLFHLGLTLLMVLKRVFMVLRGEAVAARTGSETPGRSGG